MKKNVVVLGASLNTHRPASRACQLLQQAGHKVYAVAPHGLTVHGAKGYKCLKDIHDQVDTVSIYVRESILKDLVDGLLELKPKRVIFNPGTESPAIVDLLENVGIEVVYACSLVLVQTKNFLM